MRKLFTLAALLLMMVATANASEVKVKLTSSMFYNWSDGTATATKGTSASSACSVTTGSSTGLVYGNGSVTYTQYADVAKYKQLVMICSAGTPRPMFNRLVHEGQAPVNLIDCGNNSDQKAAYMTSVSNADGTTTYTVNLAKIKNENSFVHLLCIKGANWGNVTVNKMYLVKDGELEEGEEEFAEYIDDGLPSANLNRYNYLQWSDATSTATVKGLQTQFEGVLGSSAITAWGHGAVWNDSYADLSGITRIEAVVATGTPRFMFNRDETVGAAHAILSVYPDDNTGKAYVKTYPTEGGTLWVIDVAKIVTDQGYAHLQAVKGLYNVVATVNSIKLRGTQDKIDELVNIAKEKAMEWSNATSYDASDLTNATLTPANPNCIIIAKAGSVTNTTNVMVGTTIANLAITDGKPFAVPAGATATAASYSRTVGDVKYGTICLPYAVQSNDDVQYYELNASDANFITIAPVATVEAGTPAIFHKFSADEAITAEGSGELKANTDGSSTGSLTLKGTYTQQVFTSGLDTKYYISGDKVMQATSSLTINPFRAYMEASSNDNAKSFNILVFEDNVTAINALFNADNSDVKVAAIYSADGAQQAELQKGINIVKFSNGTSKTVIMK